jgi:inner membrane protein involved in colicin E2 resistance
VHPIARVFGIIVVFLTATVAWMILGGVNNTRTGEQKYALEGRVSDLWGRAQVQKAPGFFLAWDEEVVEVKETTDAIGNVTGTRTERRVVRREQAVTPDSTRAHVDLKLDQRRKGLLWFPLYDVAFDGAWAYTHAGPDRDLVLRFSFPDEQGSYDAVRIAVDGVDLGRTAQPVSGVVTHGLRVTAGQKVTFDAGYRSRGSTEWTYQPTEGVGQVEDFQLTMTTDFAAIDFPAMTQSPSTRTPVGGGWTLDWTFSRLVTGYGIGMVMPQVIQPGELAQSLAFSAPLSLGLFFLWIFALGIIRGTVIHPINNLFIAAAFFAFNLLFSYTADRLPVEWAFALSSAVSVLLVSSYLRLVVGARFALVEAGLAQLLYQVGFAVAHFWDGFTGLTITVLGIVTLFALMQLTGRIDWSKALAGQQAKPVPEPAG